MFQWSDIRYFKPQEFDSPDLPGSGSKMDLAFIAKLDKLREAIKRPLIITSGFRTLKHNDKVGGVDSSSHTTGNAVDIAAPSSGDRYAIIEAAMRLGFRRIGIGSTFIHIDDSIRHAQDVCWTYPEIKRG